MKNFPQWLDDEIKARGMTKSEVARLAGMTPTAISDVINGKRNPGTSFYTGVAKALDLPVEEVLRAAGVLKPITQKDTLRERLISRIRESEASEEDLETLDRIAGTILDRNKRPKAVRTRAEA